MIHTIPNYVPRELSIAELKAVLKMKKYWHKQGQKINKKLTEVKDGN